MLCLAYQGAAPLTLLKDAVLGFSAQSPELATMIDGGGIVSMLQVGAIVCLSSSYSGIFQRTGLLEPIRRRIEAWGAVLSPYAAVLVTSVLASAIACNQTLSIMLTHQLCGRSGEKPGKAGPSIWKTAPWWWPPSSPGPLPGCPPGLRRGPRRLPADGILPLSAPPLAAGHRRPGQARYSVVLPNF